MSDLHIFKITINRHGLELLRQALEFQLGTYEELKCEDETYKDLHELHDILAAELFKST